MAQQRVDSVYDGETCGNVMFQPRAYQLEMLEASRKGNTIVAVTRCLFLLISGLFANVLLPDGHRKWQDADVSKTNEREVVLFYASFLLSSYSLYGTSNKEYL